MDGGNAMKSVARSVLVVDDDPEVLEFLIQTLSAGHTVLSATNGEDAVQVAQRERPDLILLDVMMPGGKDGFSVFAELQKDPRTRDIPVLMQTDVNRKTGLSFDATIMGKHLGKAPAGFLQKPVSARKLLEEVGKVLK
jgi:CheY-like chemotaxis protein